MDNNYRIELLNKALEERIKEVTEYQVNIDNFKLAIQKINADLELKNFKDQLDSLLHSSIIEQRKALVMLEVIREQLGD